MPLYLVPTPIGNLGDITLRALDVLKGVDRIACEDTRQSGKLLSFYEIKKPLVSFHEYSSSAKVQELIHQLKEGKSLALVSDSGTPLISDPGFPLIREALREGIAIESLPGACAAVTALSASGLPAVPYSFFGFLPPKSAARRKELMRIQEREETLVFYESPYRLLKTLRDMEDTLGNREAAVARELTKKFEEICRGRLSDCIAAYSARKILGEFVIVVAGFGRKEIFQH